jgi:ubiquinone biosynthesis protein UbiJ
MTKQEQARPDHPDRESTLSLALAAVMESALQQYLKQDPQVLQQCARLQGKVIGLEIRDLGLQLFFLPNTEGVQVLAHCEQEPHTRLSGTVSGFARMALGSQEDALFGGAVEIQGDTENGQAFQDILAHVDLDWEEQLSHLTGDVIAHHAGKLVRESRQYLGQTRDTLEQNLSEYLQEEARLLPTRIELQHFLNQVDHLRNDSDRLSARVTRLLDTIRSAK